MRGSDNTGNKNGALTLAESFSPRHNSLNFLRLVLAVAVIFSHGITLGGFGNENVFGKTTLGSVAVYGFFGLSGYLIAGSAQRNHVGRYLWQRALRILPAFWICLLVTAFFFGLLGWIHAHHSIANHCGIWCYVSEPSGPLGYLYQNFWLQMNQMVISTSPHSGILWNGSLWTLFSEFLCYILLAVLSLIGLLRHRIAVVALACAALVAEVVVASIPTLNLQFNSNHNWNVTKMLMFVPIFLTGSLIYLYRDKIPDSSMLAGACVLLFLVGFAIPVGSDVPTFSLTSINLTAPFLVYPLLWFGIHLPFQKIGARNDYSYGVYIYAFPVQQLLVLWGANRWGYLPYTLLALLGVIPFAVASWWLIEKNALKLKSLDVRAVRTRAPSKSTLGIRDVRPHVPASDLDSSVAKK